MTETATSARWVRLQGPGCGCARSEREPPDRIPKRCWYFFENELVERSTNPYTFEHTFEQWPIAYVRLWSV